MLPRSARYQLAVTGGESRPAPWATRALSLTRPGPSEAAASATRGSTVTISGVPCADPSATRSRSSTAGRIAGNTNVPASVEVTVATACQSWNG